MMVAAGASPSGVSKQSIASEQILAHNAGREPERLAIKYAAMRGSVFAFLRATPSLFHQRMVANGLAPDGPPAWSSGDLHLENFGTYLGGNGLVYFDINDFDAALLAPAGWDIVRLATSMLVAAPALSLNRAEAAGLARRLLQGYREALSSGKASWVERRTAEGLIGELMRRLKRRDPAKFLDARTKTVKGERSLIIDGKRVLPLAAKERQRLSAWLKSLANSARERDTFALLDAGRRVAGVSSLGTARYTILVEGQGGTDGNLLLELKSAQPSATAPYSPCHQPAWRSEAERIVEVQKRCQAVPPGLWRAVTFDGEPFVLRELQPSQDRLDLAAAVTDLPALGGSLFTMGCLSAWAQLRSSGRQGSATADELIGFAVGTLRVTALLESARAMDAIVRADWQEFCASYDEGRFTIAR